MAISPLERVQRRARLGLSGLDRGHRPSHRRLDEGLKKLVVVEEVRIDRGGRETPAAAATAEAFGYSPHNTPGREGARSSHTSNFRRFARNVRAGGSLTGELMDVCWVGVHSSTAGAKESRAYP